MAFLTDVRGGPAAPVRLVALIGAAMSLLALAGCGGDGDAATRTAPNGDVFNDADVSFATDMIPHHAQAMEMVDLTLGRDLSPEVAELAEGIRARQGAEIEQLVDWLTAWGEPVPETSRDHANAHGDGEVEMGEMPGTLTEEEMSSLEAAQGAEFETRWLELMTEHHTGAVEMARTEQSSGAFGPATKLAAEIESDQRSEIETMEGLLPS